MAPVPNIPIVKVSPQMKKTSSSPFGFDEEDEQVDLENKKEDFSSFDEHESIKLDESEEEEIFGDTKSTSYSEEKEEEEKILSFASSVSSFNYTSKGKSPSPTHRSPAKHSEDEEFDDWVGTAERRPEPPKATTESAKKWSELLASHPKDPKAILGHLRRVCQGDDGLLKPKVKEGSPSSPQRIVERMLLESDAILRRERKTAIGTFDLFKTDLHEDVTKKDMKSLQLI